jgi:hypothetical protein
MGHRYGVVPPRRDPNDRANNWTCAHRTTEVNALAQIKLTYQAPIGRIAQVSRLSGELLTTASPVSSWSALWPTASVTGVRAARGDRAC